MQDLSSLTRDRTHAPCSGSASLNYWATREVLTGSPLNFEKTPWLLPWEWVLKGEGRRLVRRLPGGQGPDQGGQWRRFRNILEVIQYT